MSQETRVSTRSGASATRPHPGDEMSQETCESTVAVVLAAGRGTRMRSALPKVLHRAAGRPIVEHVVHAALGAGISRIVVVVGHGREEIEAHLGGRFGEAVRFAVQEDQRGTGHAVAAALPSLPADATRVLVLCGDTPLLRSETLRDLVAESRADVALLTTTLDEPRGYGRILRDEAGRVIGIREERDASSDERAIREVNPGVYCFSRGFLEAALPTLSTDNAQGEFYLTDTLARASSIAAIPAAAIDMLGVNDRDQLATAETELLARLRRAHRRAGVTLREGAVVHADVVLEEDVTIDEGAVLRGATRVGRGAHIGVGAVLDDVSVAPGAVLKPYSVLTGATVGARAQIGPFSHLRPGSDVHEEAHIGNFVETKATVVRRGAKANHLAYLGDGDVGEGANVGAGTIFCNYDGFQKHRTVIGKGAFIGSDSQLVAPVTIGDGAYVATGTTVTNNVPPDALAIARTKQENKEGYAPRLRARMAAAAKKAKGG